MKEADATELTSADAGEVLLQHCRSCGRAQHYPRPMCLSCGSTALELHRSAGTGQLYSYSVLYRTPLPERFATPYVVALIRLDEGPTVMGNVIVDELDQLACEVRVVAEPHRYPDGVVQPVFRLVDPD